MNHTANQLLKKVAIVHPKVGLGGSEATLVWMLEALKNNYRICLITCGTIDVLALNAYYGTHLHSTDFSVMQVPMPFVLKKTTKFAALRGRFVQRYCQKVAKDFDLVIDAYSPCDFKVRAIQFATDIAALPEIMELSGWKKYWYGPTLLRSTYLSICNWVCDSNIEAWKKNVTISNSHWTAGLIKERYGMDSKVIYPPVVGEFLPIPFEKKESGFVMIARLVGDKKIESAIEILQKVRQRGHAVHLHIIGGTGDTTYSRFLKTLFTKHADWIFFEGKVSQQAKWQIIASHKFGISCRASEPFGIAVAEMVKAGSLVFVPQSGGQTEIAANDHLIYTDIQDAVGKIEKLMASEPLQREVMSTLSVRANLFSVENFQREIQNVVGNFFEDTKQI